MNLKNLLDEIKRKKKCNCVNCKAILFGIKETVEAVDDYMPIFKTVEERELWLQIKKELDIT